MEIDRKIIELLHKRGLETDEEIAEFLSDKPKETYDPFLLPDMEEGVDLILSACDNDEKICIYGDYDADGVTSTVILTEVLSQLTDNLIQYIPSRFDEGYGLNRSAIDTIKAAGADLIVTVDCGSVSVDEVEYAKSIGLDIMVTDHHRIEDKQADTILINPARKDSEYPFPYLAGCGVAFKLAQAITDAAGLPKINLTRMLDLVALGTIGDIVPLISENRMLVKYGLRAINTSGREALKVLIGKARAAVDKIQYLSRCQFQFGERIGYRSARRHLSDRDSLGDLDELAGSKVIARAAERRKCADRAVLVQSFGKLLRDLVLSVDHKDLAGLGLKAADPLEKSQPVRVSGQSRKDGDPGSHRHILSEELDLPCAVHELSAR